MKKAILIFSNLLDGGDTTFVERRLREKGETVFRFDTQSYAEGKIYIGLSESGKEILQNEQNELRLDEVGSVWFRRPGEITPPVSDERQRQFAKKELGELVEQLYQIIPQARWVSRPDAIRKATHKYPQLGIAKSLGFQVPRTCMTNSPTLAREFISTCLSGAVYKTLYRPAMMLDYETDTDDPETRIVPTARLSEKDASRLGSLPLTGGIFQEYIEKDYELRVTVMGDKALAARIDSQTNPDEMGRTDWRMGQNIAKSYELPTDIARKCKDLVRSFNLTFGAIDLIKTPDGRYVFLELNPNGQWAWLEELTGDSYIDTFISSLVIN